ncbi:restriction endonuclease subunit S, partial [Ligilactobacillus salivarius]
KIAKFLEDFDSLIALHQRKLEKLKQLKKFLLQNMFI